MAKPLRALERVRIRVRRRHRSWMYSMILATLGWGTWWVALFIHRFLPAWCPGVTLTYWVAFAPAAAGLFLAVFTIRARLIWVLLAGVPIFSNAFLLCMPWVLDKEIVSSFVQKHDPAPLPEAVD